MASLIKNYRLHQFSILVVFLLNVNVGHAQKVLTTNFGHSSNTRDITFSRDGKYLLTGSQDQTVKLWEVKSGKELKTYQIQSSSEYHGLQP